MTTPPAERPPRDYRAIAFRALFMLLFVLFYGLAEAVVCAVAVVQVGFHLILGAPNARLTHFGAQLARYLYQLVQYWTYNTDLKPFPFADWPSSEPLR